MKIAVDAMGGDHAPKEIIDGVYQALQQFDDIHILLFANANIIRLILANMCILEM